MLGVLLGLLLTAGTPMVLADEPEPGAAPSDERGLGAPEGYPSDDPWPGAVVHQEAVRPLDRAMAPLAVYRSGWTDGWYDWHWPLFSLVGSHDSDSDLVEDQIFVDGFMDVKIVGKWSDSCFHHTTGTHAHCNTLKKYYLKYSFYVESHHFFHKEGYGDQYFETGKVV